MKYLKRKSVRAEKLTNPNQLYFYYTYLCAHTFTIFSIAIFWCFFLSFIFCFRLCLLFWMKAKKLIIANIRNKRKIQNKNTEKRLFTDASIICCHQHTWNDGTPLKTQNRTESAKNPENNVHTKIGYINQTLTIRYRSSWTQKKSKKGIFCFFWFLFFFGFLTEKILIKHAILSFIVVFVEQIFQLQWFA